MQHVQVEHPFIVNLLTTFQDPCRLYMILDFMQVNNSRWLWFPNLSPTAMNVKMDCHDWLRWSNSDKYVIPSWMRMHWSYQRVVVEACWGHIADQRHETQHHSCDCHHLDREASCTPALKHMMDFPYTWPSSTQPKLLWALKPVTRNNTCTGTWRCAHIELHAYLMIKPMVWYAILWMSWWTCMVRMCLGQPCSKGILWQQNHDSRHIFLCSPDSNLGIWTPTNWAESHLDYTYMVYIIFMTLKVHIRKLEDSLHIALHLYSGIQSYIEWTVGLQAVI